MDPVDPVDVFWLNLFVSAYIATIVVLGVHAMRLGRRERKKRK